MIARVGYQAPRSLLLSEVWPPTKTLGTSYLLNGMTAARHENNISTSLSQYLMTMISQQLPVVMTVIAVITFIFSFYSDLFRMFDCGYPTPCKFMISFILWDALQNFIDLDWASCNDVAHSIPLSACHSVRRLSLTVTDHCLVLLGDYQHLLVELAWPLFLASSSPQTIPNNRII